jgi:hypothetical protein
MTLLQDWTKSSDGSEQEGLVDIILEPISESFSDLSMTPKPVQLLYICDDWFVL